MKKVSLIALAIFAAVAFSGCCNVCARSKPLKGCLTNSCGTCGTCKAAKPCGCKQTEK